MINSWPAIWYDGRTSRGCAVTVSREGDALRVVGEGVDRRHPLAEVRVDPGLGSVRRMLRFPDGATAEMTADAFLDGLLRRQGKGRFFSRVHGWETSLKMALTALLLTLLVAFCCIRYGIPFLAARAAFALPAATSEAIGRETLQFLDKFAMQPTKLPEGRRRELSRLFRALVAGRPDLKGCRLELRSSPAIGANAFALPSGIVILTDRMVEISTNDNEIAAVLAHEVGHVTRRHALRHLLQNSATVLLVATLTGDITSVTTLAATMPTVLIDAKYSRDFEREADDAAVAYLKGKGIPVRVYAEILARLDAEHGKERDSAPRFGELFDNHPLMMERVLRVMAAEP
jgi:Zn-dependent protease with chaperone function